MSCMPSVFVKLIEVDRSNGEQFLTLVIEFFAIKDLAVSVTSGRSESEFYLFVFGDTCYL